MNIVVQAPEYLDQTSSIEQLVNEVGPEIDMEVDEVGELLQILQGQLVSFRFATDPIPLKQQDAIQLALDDCAHARAIQARLTTFISSLQALRQDGEAHDPPGQITTMNRKEQGYGGNEPGAH
jgi:hypothetical protein